MSRALGGRGSTLPASTAYSDSDTDRPFLEVVGHPVAVNPDRLLRLARGPSGRGRCWSSDGGASPACAAAVRRADAACSCGAALVLRQPCKLRTDPRAGLLQVDAATLADHFLAPSSAANTGHGHARVTWLEGLPKGRPAARPATAHGAGFRALATARRARLSDARAVCARSSRTRRRTRASSLRSGLLSDRDARVLGAPALGGRAGGRR